MNGSRETSSHALLVCTASLIASSCDDKWIVTLFQSIATDHNEKCTTKVVGDNHLLIDRS